MINQLTAEYINWRTACSVPELPNTPIGVPRRNSSVNAHWKLSLGCLSTWAIL